MIVNNNLQGIAGAYMRNVNQVKTSAKNDKNQQANARDEIVISDTARTFSAPLGLLRSNADSVRADKVAYFAEQIASGNYTIDPQGIAAKIMTTRF